MRAFKGEELIMSFTSTIPSGNDESSFVLSRIREILASFVPVAANWLSEDGSFCDPYETQYSENYAPANAAVLFAAVYRTTGDAAILRLFRAALDRSVILLQDRQVTPFCRVFLIHYSLMAISLLEGNARAEAAEAYGPFMAAYEDDCLIINTNCAALQWGTEMLLELLDYRPADAAHLERRIAFIQKAQLESGFINDEISEHQAHDGMPIAYHAFTLFIMTSVISLLPVEDGAENEEGNERGKSTCDAARDNAQEEAKNASENELHAHSQSGAQQLISKGLEWLKHTITSDGSFAMVERSSHQTFTWGALTALYAYSGWKEDGMLERILSYWLPFRHQDGSLGCTPNTLPHSLRIGYETYTHLNMYNLLGLTGLAAAGQLLERGLSLNLNLHPSEQQHSLDGSCSDEDSGYAFFRRGEDFFACTLRMHHREYAPAMQGFHYRLGGRALPLAEPRLTGYQQSKTSQVQEGVWEGYLLNREPGDLGETDRSTGSCDSIGSAKPTEESGLAEPVYPNSKVNAELTTLANGFQLTNEIEALRCVKKIQLLEDGIALDYQLALKRTFHTCEHVISLLVHDGKHVLRIRQESTQRLTMSFGSECYTLECAQAASMELRLERSLLSVSGVSAQLRISLPLAATAPSSRTPAQSAETAAATTETAETAGNTENAKNAEIMETVNWRTTLRKIPG
ncbi:hypothetical protein [Paenibacillus eucommiae]|uniref:Heparinase n=1 Tax=Paenibacillus eucommiae TaxID=1355755 RepID=A0ABS4IXB0_9BACL|nr:hypothetical protein [Paenibacillus eucommiae]MBP1992225.1 hypothetical protein [Paenibacillus eucommiae]